MSTQMLSRRLHLPDEVLVEILSHLRPRDIAACQRSCRQLNDVVVCSRFLQYLLRVGRSGLHDPMLPGYTIPQRIEALDKWEATWRNLEAQSSFQVERERIVACDLAGRRCSRYIIRDDFLIAIPGFGVDLLVGYAYIDLRVFQPGGETDPWTRIIKDNWSGKRSTSVFLPEQDLFVTTCWSTDESPSTLIEIHGFSFSRGTPHPRFVSATITTTQVPRSIDVRIVGNHTILNVQLRTSLGLFLHSWKDGRVSQLRDAPLQAWSGCCAVLSHDTFALADLESATLEVCRIVQEPDSDTASLRTLIRLGLPPLASESKGRVLQSYCIPEQMPVYSGAPPFVVEGRPPRRRPFHNSPEESIVAITFRIGLSIGPHIATRYLTIVTHLRTLIAHATTTLPEVNFIPWKDWGPSGTAYFERFIMSDACVGERLAMLSYGKLCVFDFNSTRVQNAIRKAGRPSQNAVYSVVKDKVVIPRGQLFGIDIVSELPYISVKLPVPSHWESLHNYEGVLAGSSTSVDDQGDNVNIYITR